MAFDTAMTNSALILISRARVARTYLMRDGPDTAQNNFCRRIVPAPFNVLLMVHAWRQKGEFMTKELATCRHVI